MEMTVLLPSRVSTTWLASLKSEASALPAKKPQNAQAGPAEMRLARLRMASAVRDACRRSAPLGRGRVDARIVLSCASSGHLPGQIAEIFPIAPRACGFLSPVYRSSPWQVAWIKRQLLQR